MTDLVVLVPSRGRPQAVREMMASFNQTCELATTLSFVVDSDDPRLPDYIAEAEGVWSSDLHDGPVELDLSYHRPNTSGKGMVAALNQAAQTLLFAPETTPFAIGFMGDDHRPRTQGWDRRYVETLREGKLIVWGDDLLQGEAMPTQVAIQSAVVGKLGYMAPVGFFHLCVDLVWKDWGLQTGRWAYLPDVVVEHMHPAVGKAHLDEGYERVNASAVVAKDSAWYYTWKETRLAGEVALLREIP